MNKILLSLVCFLFLAVIGCQKKASTQLSKDSGSPTSQKPTQVALDVCGLITKEEIEAIQGSPVNDTKSSGTSNGGLRVSQCYYATAEASKSVSLAVTQIDPGSPTKRSPKDFWKETFDRYKGEVKTREGDEEKKESLRKQEKEESVPPKKIEGISDEAYWIGNRFGGALYVLKKDTFIRISVGGPDKEEIKIDKSKVLAQKALERL